jgi:hypothetical protein
MILVSCHTCNGSEIPLLYNDDVFNFKALIRSNKDKLML